MRSLLALLTVAAPVFADPASAVAAALADAKKLTKEECHATRYLDLSGVEEKQREELVIATSFWLNMNSRSPLIVKPRQVTPELLAFTLDDYGLDAVAYGKVSLDDSHFHVFIQQGKEKTIAAGGWLGPAAITELMQLTGSQIPIVGADLFIWATSVQENRKSGYYGLNRFNTLQDFFKVGGVDEKLAKESYKEVKAAISRSTVGINSREVTGLGSICGRLWRTTDVNTSQDKQNALRLLDGIIDGDASELICHRSNGMVAMALVNLKDGKLQKSVPPNLASDDTSATPDRRVHVGQCMRCHVQKSGGAFQPLDDYVRKVFNEADGPLRLASADREKLFRLKVVYLTDYKNALDADNKMFNDAVFKATGKTPREAVRAWNNVFERFEGDRTIHDISRMHGTTPDNLRKVLASQGANLDLVLAGLLKTPPLTIRGDMHEELFGTIEILLAGKK